MPSRIHPAPPDHSPPVFLNQVLAALTPAAIERLELKRVDLPLHHDIEIIGTPIRNVIFIEAGLASMTNTFRNGDQAEVAVSGVESICSISAFFGIELSLNRVYMQIAGHGYSSPIAAAVTEFDRNGRFHTLALQAFQAQYLQTAQTAGCNARHPVEQRLARWLLLCADRIPGNTYHLSHAHLADMLGSTRSTVTVAAGHLQKLGLIKYSRGKVHLLDRAGLEHVACECYLAVKDHLARLASHTPTLTRSA